MKTDEFYIGYLKEIPRDIRKFLGILIPFILATLLFLGLILPAIHYQFSTGSYTKAQDFEGLLISQPIPQLLVPRLGHLNGHDPYSRYILASTRKTGVSQKVLDLSGKWVKLRAIPVFRDNMTLLAVSSKIEPQIIDPPLSSLPPPTQRLSLGSVTLTGEIIDLKCYLGVMKPGHTVIHRNCAIRCISGGIPPALKVMNEQGNPLYLILVDQNEKAINEKILSWVTDPVTLSGEVLQYGDLLVLKVARISSP